MIRVRSAVVGVPAPSLDMDVLQLWLDRIPLGPILGRLLSRGAEQRRGGGGVHPASQGDLHNDDTGFILDGQAKKLRGRS